MFNFKKEREIDKPTYRIAFCDENNLATKFGEYDCTFETYEEADHTIRMGWRKNRSQKVNDGYKIHSGWLVIEERDNTFEKELLEKFRTSDRADELRYKKIINETAKEFSSYSKINFLFKLRKQLFSIRDKKFIDEEIDKLLSAELRATNTDLSFLTSESETEARAILRTLSRDPISPLEISEKVGISLQKTNSILLILRGHNLVKKITENA